MNPVLDYSAHFSRAGFDDCSRHSFLGTPAHSKPRGQGASRHSEARSSQEYSPVDFPRLAEVHQMLVLHSVHFSSRSARGVVPDVGRCFGVTRQFVLIASFDRA
jgi:hypothetical protein